MACNSSSMPNAWFRPAGPSHSHELHSPNTSTRKNFFFKKRSFKYVYIQQSFVQNESFSILNVFLNISHSINKHDFFWIDIVYSQLGFLLIGSFLVSRCHNPFSGSLAKDIWHPRKPTLYWAIKHVTGKFRLDGRKGFRAKKSYGNTEIFPKEVVKNPLCEPLLMCYQHLAVEKS